MQTRVVSAEQGIDEAARLIREGSLVAFPTETVYGLGADGLNGPACARIFAVKGRPADNPLIVHGSSLDNLGSLMRGEPSPLMRRLAEQFWPGPLTMVVPARANVPAVVRGGLPTVAVRVPRHPVALALIEASGCALAAPSANRSGWPSPTRAAHVFDDLNGKIPLILDGGETHIGVESTVIDLTVEPPALLRPGGTPREWIEAVTGPLQHPQRGAVAKAPGMKYRHYAPKLPVYWIQSMDDEEILRVLATLGEPVNIGVLAPHSILERIAWPKGVSLGNSTEDAAHRLFSGLRMLDRPDLKAIAVVWKDEPGLGEAVANRLAKASQGVQ